MINNVCTSTCFKPITNFVRCEFWTVVTPKILRYTTADEQVAQPLQNVLALERPCHVDRQALPREFIDDR